MKRIVLLLLFMLMLLSGCTLKEELFTDKQTGNPIPEGTTTLLFTPASGAKTRIVSDPEVIAALRSAYRWTNEHLYCCLEGEVEASMTVAVHGSRRSSEPDKVYADLSIPSYNAEFRRLLYSAWESAPAQ